VGDLVSLTERLNAVGPRRGMRKGTSAMTWYERGLELEAFDADGAIAAYRRAIAGRADFADAHNNLGRLVHDRGDLAAAESSYRLALCSDDRVALYWFNLGVVLEDLGRIAESIVAYENALAIDALMADAHFNLARQIEVIARKDGDEIMLRRAVRHLKQYRALSRASG
jgi:tetratricopeptide (TPR) repeat protein